MQIPPADCGCGPLPPADVVNGCMYGWLDAAASEPQRSTSASPGRPCESPCESPGMQMLRGGLCDVERHTATACGASVMRHSQVSLFLSPTPSLSLSLCLQVLVTPKSRRYVTQTAVLHHMDCCPFDPSELYYTYNDNNNYNKNIYPSKDIDNNTKITIVIVKVIITIK